MRIPPHVQLLALSSVLVATLGGAVTFLGGEPAVTFTRAIAPLHFAIVWTPVPVPSPSVPTLAPAPVTNVAVAAVSTPTAVLAVPTPTATAAPVVPTATPTPEPVVVLDEAFSANSLGWPDDPDSSAWLTPGGYQLEPREPGRFVAVSPPGAPILDRVQVTATFHKLAGRPLGGGYGIIVRDEESVALDGWNVTGRYYVLEVTDLGEVGVFRRETDHWEDLLSWTPSSAVHPGTEENQLVVRTEGPRLTLLVNGMQAAQIEDQAIASGRVGVFTGGDGNAAMLTRFLVAQLP
jgi:hypothetical protein